MLLDALGATLFRYLLTGKGRIRAGDGVFKADQEL